VLDGLAAVVRAIETLPDLIVLDVNMPKLGASEVIAQLKSNLGTREIPIVVMTDTVRDSRSYLIDAGAADIFVKPFEAETLVSRLIDLGRRADRGASGRD
jgi:CheY-like chemotaxis protein